MAAWVSSLSLGSESRVIVIPCRPTWPRQPALAVRAPDPVSGRFLHDHQQESADQRDRGFPMRFRRRHSLLGHPSPAGAIDLPHGQPTSTDHNRAGPGGVSTFRTHKARSGRAPSLARRRWCSVQADHDHRPAPGASQRHVPAPRHILFTARLSLTSHQRGFKQFARPIFPSPDTPGWINSAFGFPPGFALRDYSQRTPGRGRIIEHGPEISATASAEPPTSRIYLMRATSRRTRETRSELCRAGRMMSPRVAGGGGQRRCPHPWPGGHVVGLKRYGCGVEI